MLKIANQVLDAFDDVGMESLKKLASKYPTLYVMTPEEKAGLGDHDYALSVITKTASKINKFPINDQDNTVLSNEFFGMNGHKLPNEAASIAAFHIKSACLRYGVKPNPAVAALSKVATSNVYFEKEGALRPKVVVAQGSAEMDKIAQVEDVANNYTSAQYAMPSQTHVKVAAKYLETNKDKIPSELRHKYAAAIQRRAHELGMQPLKGEISKYASDHYNPMIDAHVRSRVALLDGRPEAQGDIEKIGSYRSKMSPAEFARALHAFDKTAGLNRYYGSHLTDPYLATFAAEPDAYAGYRYKTGAAKELLPDDLARLVTAKYSDIKNYLGQSFADELKKHPVAIFDSLPKDAKELIAGMVDGTV